MCVRVCVIYILNINMYIVLFTFIKICLLFTFLLLHSTNELYREMNLFTLIERIFQFLWS